MIDVGKCGILTLLNLSAAFDTIVHEKLLCDCEKILKEGLALAYLKSYLENRTYHVLIGEAFSEVKTLKSCVPQGSVLGPILLCIYNNKLSHLFTKHDVDFKLFADDTQFYLTLNYVKDTEANLSDIMTDIGLWMNF